MGATNGGQPSSREHGSQRWLTILITRASGVPDDPGTRLQRRTMNLPGMQVVARTLVLELGQVTAGTLDDILVTDSLRRPKRTQKKLQEEGRRKGHVRSDPGRQVRRNGNSNAYGVICKTEAFMATTTK
jgi:hypothetical protein